MPRRKFYRAGGYDIRQQAANRERRRDIEARASALLFRQDIRYYIKYRSPEHRLDYSVESPHYTHDYVTARAQRHEDIRAHRADQPRADHFIG